MWTRPLWEPVIIADLFESGVEPQVPGWARLQALAQCLMDNRLERQLDTVMDAIITLTRAHPPTSALTAQAPSICGLPAATLMLAWDNQAWHLRTDYGSGQMSFFSTSAGQHPHTPAPPHRTESLTLQDRQRRKLGAT